MKDHDENLILYCLHRSSRMNTVRTCRGPNESTGKFWLAHLKTFLLSVVSHSCTDGLARQCPRKRVFASCPRPQTSQEIWRSFLTLPTSCGISAD